VRERETRGREGGGKREEEGGGPPAGSRLLICWMIYLKKEKE